MRFQMLSDKKPLYTIPEEVTTMDLSPDPLLLQVREMCTRLERELAVVAVLRRFACASLALFAISVLCFSAFLLVYDYTAHCAVTAELEMQDRDRVIRFAALITEGVQKGEDRLLTQIDHLLSALELCSSPGCTVARKE
ncbi:ORF29 [Ranid herpesvirus 2]|uniref:ORF29 n=1 Tax=Ranid herpesvirus 2 TaxID=389214 RepID=Q14W77_9VIRU|nr:ORF29 [Ranid herpesvirus 2]ABG25687.1 ORF29 [Ranid herpesvirus 2]